MTAPGTARKRSETRQRTEMVALRFLPHEKADLEAAAASAGQSVSAYIRAAALAAARKDPEVADAEAVTA